MKKDQNNVPWGYGLKFKQEIPIIGRMEYAVILEKGRESGYVAVCPTLRGCVAQGNTKQSALKNMKEASKDYIECLIEDGIPVPQEEGKEMVEMEVMAQNYREVYQAEKQFVPCKGQGFISEGRNLAM